MNEILEMALKYKRHCGFSVIPVAPNKQPYVKWEQYQKDLPSDEQIKTWWQKFPNANVGIITGKVSGIVVIDIDDPFEIAKMYVLTKHFCPAVRTPRPGMHLYFKYEEGMFNQQKDSKIHIRGEGGYVVAPPSIHENGNKYTWVKGFDIFSTPKVKVTPEILAYYNINKDGGVLGGEGNETPKIAKNKKEKQKVTECHKHVTLMSQDVTLDNCDKSDKSDICDKVTDVTSVTEVSEQEFFTEQGSRDEKLFHIAWQMFKGGATDQEIREALYPLADSCDPPFPRKEVEIKILSVLKRGEKTDRTLATEVKDYLDLQTGYFDINELYRDLVLTSKQEKDNLRKILQRIVKQGIIEPYGGRSGRYRKVESDIDIIDYMTASTEEFKVNLPLGISYHCIIYPGNVIVAAGYKSAGKTAYMLNIVKDNMDINECVYMTSEMRDNEMRNRLELFPNMSLDMWNFKAIFRSDNWQDLITPEKKIFLIDYLDVTDEFWKVGTIIKDIHKKLKDGIAIIALQKKGSRDTGHGDALSMEKARCYLALDWNYTKRCNMIKIVDTKAFRHENPRGYVKEYKISKGSEYFEEGEWYDENYTS